MSIADFIARVASEPERTIPRLVRKPSPELLERMKRQRGMPLIDFLAALHAGSPGELRYCTSKHVLGPPASEEAIARLARAISPRTLSADLLTLVRQINGIHLWADAERGRSYEGLAPIEEWRLAHEVLIEPESRDLVDNRYFVITYHDNGDGFVVIDFETGWFYFADQRSADEMSCIAENVDGLLEHLWDHRIAPVWPRPALQPIVDLLRRFAQARGRAQSNVSTFAFETLYGERNLWSAFQARLATEDDVLDALLDRFFTGVLRTHDLSARTPAWETLRADLARALFMPSPERELAVSLEEHLEQVLAGDNLGTSELALHSWEEHAAFDLLRARLATLDDVGRARGLYLLFKLARQFCTDQLADAVRIGMQYARSSDEEVRSAAVVLAARAKAALLESPEYSFRPPPSNEEVASAIDLALTAGIDEAVMSHVERFKKLAGGR